MKKPIRNETVYSFWKKREKICTGTVNELSEKLGISKGCLYQLNHKPTHLRRLEIEGTLVPMFELFTKEGEVVFKGSIYECADYMCVSDMSVLAGVRETLSGERTGRQGGLLVRRAGKEFRKDEMW